MNMRLNKLCEKHLATGLLSNCPACSQEEARRKVELTIERLQREISDLRAENAALQAARNGKRKGARA